MSGAAVAAGAISALHHRPILLTVLIGLLVPLFLWRWHTPRDLTGLLVGATFGNLTELVSDLGRVWIHAAPQILGVSPLYIFACYPILGLALPRLTDTVAGRTRPTTEGDGAVLFQASLLWGVHLALSYCFGTDNTAELLVSTGCLGVTLFRFHSPHDTIAAASGALLALVWELPSTWSRAWRFPHPELFGLIPLWLPLAYAVFFINMSRITAALTGGLVTGRAVSRGYRRGRSGP
jgi:hypothetical protein